MTIAAENSPKRRRSLRTIPKALAAEDEKEEAQQQDKRITATAFTCPPANKQGKVSIQKETFDKMAKTTQKAMKSAAEFQKEAKALRAEKKEWEAERSTLTANISDLQEKCASFKHELEKLKVRAVPSSGKGTKRKISINDLNKDLRDHLYANKHIHFRNWKFITSEKKEAECINQIYEYITIDLDEITKEDLIRDYGYYIRTNVIGAERNYLQTRAQDKVRGKKFFVNLQLIEDGSHLFCKNYTEWWNKKGSIPTMDQVMAAMKAPTEDGSKDILLWYYDSLLPAVARKYWEPEVRYYTLYTANTCTIPGRDGTIHANKAWITTATEAFALVLLANCEDKWPKMFEKEKNGEKIPKSGKEAAAYKAKWSNPNAGQVPYGGWLKPGIELFNKLKKEIKSIRDADAANDNALAKFVYNLLREANGITGNSPEEDSDNKRKKKKAKTTDDASTDATVLEEDDDDDTIEDE